jgi:hypothetical protein
MKLIVLYISTRSGMQPNPFSGFAGRVGSGRRSRRAPELSAARNQQWPMARVALQCAVGILRQYADGIPARPQLLVDRTYGASVAVPTSSGWSLQPTLPAEVYGPSWPKDLAMQLLKPVRIPLGENEQPPQHPGRDVGDTGSAMGARCGKWVRILCSRPMEG